MENAEYELLRERLSRKDDAFALAFLLTYAHAKNTATPQKGEDYLAKRVKVNYEILREVLPETIKHAHPPDEPIKSVPTLKDVDVTF